MVLQLAAMALLVLIINVFNMTNILMTCVFAMLAQWRMLCASVWLLVSDPPRDTTSTGYEPRNDPCCVRLTRFAGSRFRGGSVVTTTEVTLHKCNHTRYNRSLIAPQLALLVCQMLVNCSDALRSNLNVEFGSVHPAFHEVLDETNSLLSKFPPLTHSHDAIRFTMLQSQNHSMDASTEFSPTLVNASKNCNF